MNLNLPVLISRISWSITEYVICVLLRTIQLRTIMLNKPCRHFKELWNNTEGSVSTRLSRILFQYRRTLHRTTSVSPAELLLGIIPRSYLDLLKPEVTNQVKDKQKDQQKHHATHVKLHEFKVGEEVSIKGFPASKDWLPGVVYSADGPRSYHITRTDERRVHRRIDHIRKCSFTLPDQNSKETEEFSIYPLPPATRKEEEIVQKEVSVHEEVPVSSHQPLASTSRRSSKNTKLPNICATEEL